jgi:hypothetical protein
VLGIISGSWGLSLTGFLARERTRGWPSIPGSGSSVAGSGDPTIADKAAALKKTKSEFSIVPGVYLLVYKKKKLLLDTFAVPQGTLGTKGEAVLKPASATMTQEWVILPLKNSKEEEYTIQNRATGENLQPPGAEGIEVQSGVRKGGWKLVGSSVLGYNIASVHSGSVLNALVTSATELMGSAPTYAALAPAPTGDFAPGVWELDLIHSLPPNADTTLGFMPMLAKGHVALPEGVYKIVDSVTQLPLCAYTDPASGVGDYEAYLSPECTQEWFVIEAEPEPGNPDAAMDPPKIYELREGVSGALLDAYMFGTLGSHLRSDLHTIAQRWFFVPSSSGAEGTYGIGHASDLRWLSVGDGVVTTLQEHTWVLEFLRGLPPMPESAACKTVCDGDFNCGQQDDGCGGVLECGTCDVLDTCSENVCVCIPFPCEANMCGMVPNGCGADQDCGGCDAGLNCNEETHACTAGPVLPPVPNVSNATLPFETTPAPLPPVMTTPCPACDSCCDAPAPNVTVVANVTNVSKPPPPTTTTTTTTTADDFKLLQQLAPGILAHLRGIFADAAAASLHDYPINVTNARAAAWDALTVDNIVAAAHTVELTAPQQADIHDRAFKKSQAVFNRTMAQQVVEVDVLPTFMRNLSAQENVTRTMIAVADPPTFEVATDEAGVNASAVATDTVLEELNNYKSAVAERAYKSVRATTDRIAGDIAVNSLTYNLEENILNKVEFDPTSVMKTTTKKLAEKQVVQAVADQISALITLRAQNASRVNLTTPAAPPAAAAP